MPGVGGAATQAPTLDEAAANAAEAVAFVLERGPADVRVRVVTEPVRLTELTAT